MKTIVKKSSKEKPALESTELISGIIKLLEDTQKGQTVSGLFDGDALIPRVILRWGVGK
jgi:hypothetical protein